MSKGPSNRGPGKTEKREQRPGPLTVTLPLPNCGCLFPRPVGQRPMSSGEASVSQDSCVSTAARTFLWETEVTPPKLPSQGRDPTEAYRAVRVGIGD